MMRRIPDFTDPNWHVKRSDRDLTRSVLEGKGSMPAMKTKLRATEVERIIRLVRHFKGGSFQIPDEEGENEDTNRPQTPASAPAAPSTSTPANATSPPADRTSSMQVLRSQGPARALYQRLCISCHGEDGRSGPLRPSVPSAPDFASADWQGQRSDQKLMISILEGRGTRMPPFQGRISETQAGELVAFLRSLSGSPTAARIDSQGDFEQRFQQLMEQMNDLKRQYRALPQPVGEAAEASRD
jgi:mono/diheme cytochrome c family protein